MAPTFYAPPVIHNEGGFNGTGIGREGGPRLTIVTPLQVDAADRHLLVGQPHFDDQPTIMGPRFDDGIGLRRRVLKLQLAHADDLVVMKSLGADGDYRPAGHGEGGAVLPAEAISIMGGFVETPPGQIGIGVSGEDEMSGPEKK